ncbi:MAG TPA: DUF1549 and DUF1553 domain-containing protein [Tepidisphaeraceae bacterium]|jgi:hypothetical protein|nr:DUF1549 and DUF1553 domain-containing protein [Tepidisphaeraceae bacterium]
MPALLCIALGGAATLSSTDKADHWAFKPITHPDIPKTNDSGWARTPIDEFIFAKLAEKGMKPAPAADKRTLLRRVYFDLIGLPPTPEQMSAFLSDHSPDAYEKVVDSLLASPRYGERWARHWMDIVHFAETHGNDQDRERPNAWPYRDYLIQSFNADKPYGKFIEEQIAGDVLYPDDPQATVALGCIAAGPWDESSQQDIRDDTTDKKVAQNLDRDDMVQTTMATFTSTTVGCARCHDHKFDPISQADYYGLQAVFAGVDRANRDYDPDPNIFRRRHELLREKNGLETGIYVAGASPSDPAIRSEAAAWASAQSAKKSAWVTLDPSVMRSSGGATLTKLPDESILASGKRPDVDTYTISASTDIKGITAVRVELMTDDSLPHKGPGRQDNGNLHVNEFYLKAGPTAHPDQVQAVDLASARADFDQQGWTIAMSIDRNPASAWGIYPQVGQPHVGVYELKKSVGFDGGTTLTFVLEQTHGEGHLIGRLRLSATTAPLPAPLHDSVLPADIAAILDTPAAQRSEPAIAQLTTFYLKQKVDGELAALGPPKKVYAAANHFDAVNSFRPAKTPRAVFVLKRGDIAQPMQPAEPGALSCVPGLPEKFALADPADESARRAALAKWISDPKNCLTWRSIVNRVWEYHFGRGIVSSPNDFGHMGTPPTHPELLDWLANYLLEQHGSLRALHRLIVTSSVYRQSSQYNESYARIDSQNQFLWRMERTRLDAESVRDTILQVSGMLDTTMGGPSAKQFTQKPGVHVTPVLNYADFNPDDPAERRLSVYRFVYRTLPDPFMDALDCPDASQFAPARNVSITALQALAMMNDRFVVRYAEHLAQRVAKEKPDMVAQISRVYQLCLNRKPTSDELNAMTEYAKKFGMANTCRVLLNSNEFMFVN